MLHPSPLWKRLLCHLFPYILFNSLILSFIPVKITELLLLSPLSRAGFLPATRPHLLVVKTPLELYLAIPRRQPHSLPILLIGPQPSPGHCGIPSLSCFFVPLVDSTRVISS